MVLNQNGIFSRAEQATTKYGEAKEKEEQLLNNTVKFIDVTTNNKPYIEKVKYSDRTETSMKITTMATDEDGENLTYTLFIGKTRENLEKYGETQEKEQGQEVEWGVSVEDSTTTYYYKVEVKDQYVMVDTGIKETNNVPIIERIELEKNFDKITGNWIKITTSATDIENDKINITLKMWKMEEGTNEEDLMKKSPTKTEIRTNVSSGEEIKITITELEEYQDYIYRVDVADKENMTIGERALVKTYCSGTGLECDDAIPCEVCNETGVCSKTISYIYNGYIGSYMGSFTCERCGAFVQKYGEQVNARCSDCGLAIRIRVQMR